MSTHNIEKDNIERNHREKIETRHKFGQYRNVLLTDSDIKKLYSEFPTDWEERIERLSAYMASTGKSYKNHLATIRNWARNDAKKNASKVPSRNKSQWEKTDEEKQDEEAWMKNVIQC